MTRIRDIVDVLEQWAPISLAESWDNVGLFVGDSDNEVTNVLLCLDITEDIVTKAQTLDRPCIISHHPIMLKPLKTFSGRDRTTKLVRMLIESGINVYSAHTNLDRAPEGVSHALASRLGIGHCEPLANSATRLYKFVTFVPPEHTDAVREAAGNAGAGNIGDYQQCSYTSTGIGTYIPSDSATPYSGSAGELSKETEDRLEMIVPEPKVSRVIKAAKNAHPYEEMAYDLIPLEQHDRTYGYGAIGTLATPVSKSEFCDMVSSRLGINELIISSGKHDRIHNVAVMGGSGKSLITEALSQHADAFITGDIGHHAFLDYGNDILLVDASHYATEKPVLDRVKQKLNDTFDTIICTIADNEPPAIVRTSI